MIDRRAAGARLVAWYRASARDLPWRRRADPYATWVSEIMLQQTTVAAVAPRFEAFLGRFPDLASLAAATEEEVLAELQGLGYYRRFRSMLAAARVIRDGHAGVLPAERDALEALPGIGHYTAGAISSIAFGRREAAVDGNVIRVLCRLEAIPGPQESAARKRALGEIVLAMMPAGEASAFNQALFDLGAGICGPRAPLCPDCPLEDLCRARALGRVEDFPEPTARREFLDREVHVALVERRGRIYLERREDEKGRMAGFLQLPEIWCAPGEDGPEALARDLARRHGMEVEIADEVARCRHGITHHRLDCRLWSPRVLTGPRRGAGCWLTRDQLAANPVSTISRKLLRASAAPAKRRDGPGRGGPTGRRARPR
ncbi:MAG: A/G-specific adenine glycosylase [Planctomycetes bacterium]|nr:A/G-specific adenine glycosylase [Planctomycetota bacterium]